MQPSTLVPHAPRSAQPGSVSYGAVSKIAVSPLINASRSPLAPTPSLASVTVTPAGDVIANV